MFLIWIFEYKCVYDVQKFSPKFCEGIFYLTYFKIQFLVIREVKWCIIQDKRLIGVCHDYRDLFWVLRCLRDLLPNPFDS